jgi:hypothetical protein
MKKQLLFIGLLTSAVSFGQTFSDDFDSYTAGQYMAAQSGGAWTTWSGTPGSTEDVLVSNADASSGANSVFFSTSTAAGGPTDLVKNFGVLNTGQFSIEWNMLVQSGKAGYFNFQRNATIGQVWAMDCFFSDDGDITILNQSGGTLFTGSYTQGGWFNFRMDINFNTNTWEVFIDDLPVGSFANTENQIASIDIYPTDQDSPYSCGYFIDDFEYTITPYTLPAVNGAATFITTDVGLVAGAEATPKVTIRNLGTTTITSATLNVDYNGDNINYPMTGLNLVSLASTTIDMPGTVTLVAGSNTMTGTISNVNGAGADGDAADNQASMTIDPIVPALGKMVVGEEGTGTWCQYCPRGAVYMDMMETKYPDFWAGIAVHNGDPMVVTEYDDALGNLIGGYPSALVDRAPEIDPSEIEPEFLAHLTVAPTAFIIPGATWDAGTRTLVVSVSADFQASATNSYKLAVVLTEDEVTGTGSGYAQVNAYAGGANGPMGGFESLPNPVPASQMVYDHVARVIEPSFGGFANSFPAVVNSGETHTVNATFVLPASWDETKLHIIGMLVNPSGKIDNAGKATIAEALANGFVSGTDMTVGIDEENQLDAMLQMYPNPASTYTTLAINLTQESVVEVKLMDMNGKTLKSRNYGSMNGASTIQIPTIDLAKGVYLVEVSVNNIATRKTLVVE